MKRVSILLAIIGFFLTDLYSQQIPLYSLYHYNRFLYNPALAGAGESGNIFLNYRTQWVGFEGAPETRTISFDMPISKRKAGIGLYVFNDITDILRRYGGYLTYAYHLSFTEEFNHRLSFGLSAGFQDLKIDYNRINVIDETDEVLVNNGDNATSFDGSFGINYQFKDFEFGISLPQLLSTNLKYLNDEQEAFFKLQRHYLASTRYKIGLLGDSLSENKLFITPHIMFRSVSHNFENWQIDGGVTFAYKDWAWIDATYRYDYAITIGAGFKVHDLISVGYAYDLALNEMKDYAGSTHELMVGFHFGKRKKGLASEDMESLDEKLSEHDSLINELFVRLDSVEQVTDSVKALMESGGLATGDDSLSMTDAEFADLSRRIDSLLNKLKEMEGQISENSLFQKEMAEERTRVVDVKDLEFKRGSEFGDYFMVVGSFRIEKNSYSYQEQLSAQGYDVGVVYDTKRLWYYVYISQPKNYDQGLEELYRLREENAQFKDAWIHILDESMR